MSRIRVVLLMAFALASAPSIADNEKDLGEVRDRIGKLEKEISRTYARRDKLQARLAETERLTARLQTNIAKLNTEREASEKRLKSLEAQTVEQLTALKNEKSDLAAQVYSAYVGGRQEKIKLLLSQRNPSELGRVAVYYGYLNQHRLKQIDRVNEMLSTLDQLSAQAQLENQSIKQLQRQRHSELESLKAARKERQHAIEALTSRITQGADQVAKLKSEEARLVTLIEEIEQIMREFPVGSRTSFAKLKGSLTWPANGTLLARYGQSRGGSSMNWDGVLIGAERGAAVRAVAHGRVAYADWLPGQGLLVVLEHGDNYFSLYGRNDTVSAKAGDWVEAGDTIATVGDSGGQAQVALYFGLRQQSKPINPREWFKQRNP
ncbi:MAG: peptidoglycan DD-metalloendopeptidase family protein [Pseudomonadota bacterium]